MSFELLQKRLLVTVKDRIRSGEITERSLARLTGISQPHIHNVLKGARILSPELCDQLLIHLRINLMDLFSPESFVAPVPLLQGRLGPGFPLLDTTATPHSYPAPRELASSIVRPLAAHLGRDDAMLPRFRENDVVLLDQSAVFRAEPSAEAVYAVDWSGATLVRYVRLVGKRLYLASEESLPRVWAWDSVFLDDRNILDVVRARIVWTARQLGT